jgi:hypothetical protein
MPMIIGVGRTAHRSIGDPGEDSPKYRSGITFPGENAKLTQDQSLWATLPYSAHLVMRLPDRAEDEYSLWRAGLKVVIHKAIEQHRSSLCYSEGKNQLINVCNMLMTRDNQSHVFFLIDK